MGKFDTLNHAWLHSVYAFNRRPAFCIKNVSSGADKQAGSGHGPVYTEYSYGYLEKLVSEFGKGLIVLGLKAGEGVGILGEKSIFWTAADLGVISNRCFNIPLRINTSDKEIFYVFRQISPGFFIVQDDTLYRRLKRILNESGQDVKLIILDSEGTLGTNDSCFTFEDVCKTGRNSSSEIHQEFTRRRNESDPDDLVTLLYSSGTTGHPKAVPLKNRNIMHNVELVPFLLGITFNDRFLSVLPIWHILERCSHYMILRVGASIWISSFSSIIDDLKQVRPSWIVSVPLLWVNIYTVFREKLKQKGMDPFFSRVYKSSIRVIKAKRRRIRGLSGLNNDSGISLFDLIFHWMGKMVFYNSLYSRLGGNLKGIVCGGSSLPGYIDDFMEILGIPMMEGYGLTETSPVVAVRTFDHWVPHSVGLPLPDTRIKIVDENAHFKNSCKGIIHVSGPQVTSAYYNDPGATDNSFYTDDDGIRWFNTGDIGRVTQTGDLVISGRAKDTIVLLNGENIEPEPIEAALCMSDMIDQVMIYGQNQEHLTALVVPAKDWMKQENKGPDTDMTAVFQQEADWIISPANGFRESEFIWAVRITEPFSEADGTMTATRKMKRQEIERRDIDLIMSMYPYFNTEGEEK